METTPELDIKQHMLSQSEMDLVGIADVACFSDEPEGWRPEDILPGARAVVVFGKRMPDGGVQSAFRSFEDGHPVARASYGAFCADLASNFSLFFHTFNLAQYIERRFGFATTPLPRGTLQCGVPMSVPVPAFVEPFRVGLPLDIEKAAYAAGLGAYGWSGRLLTKEHGPRIQFGAVVTRMPLECDRPYDGEPICRGRSCQKCVRVCPTEAISAVGERSRTVGVPGRPTEVSEIKLNRCVVAACALRQEFGAMEDFVPGNDPSEDELKAAFERKPINHFEGLDHYPKWKCDKCLLYCPAGDWSRRFRETGMTQSCGGDAPWDG
jgi:epoxyqueuosine reductase QueG